MNAKLVDSLVQIIQTLTVAERKKLDTQLSTLTQPNKSAKISAQFQQWDRISDLDAVALKAEFTKEDLVFAETILLEYSSNLQQEESTPHPQ